MPMVPKKDVKSKKKEKKKSSCEITLINTPALLLNTVFVTTIPNDVSKTEFVMGHKINKCATQLPVHTVTDVEEPLCVE